MTFERRPQTGTLLVASPTLLDMNFSRTVILVCAHDADGTMGLVLNRPSHYSLADVLVGVPPSATDRVYWGGPVDESRFMLLQRNADTAEELPPPFGIADEVRFGSEEEFMQELMQGGLQEAARYRLYAGYAGWSEGQLQEEMDQCSWLVAPTSADLVFDTPPEAMWPRAIQSLGPEFAHLATMPLDPRVN